MVLCGGTGSSHALRHSGIGHPHWPFRKASTFRHLGERKSGEAFVVSNLYGESEARGLRSPGPNHGQIAVLYSEGGKLGSRAL